MSSSIEISALSHGASSSSSRVSCNLHLMVRIESLHTHPPAGFLTTSVTPSLSCRAHSHRHFLPLTNNLPVIVALQQRWSIHQLDCSLPLRLPRYQYPPHDSHCHSITTLPTHHGRTARTRSCSRVYDIRRHGHRVCRRLYDLFTPVPDPIFGEQFRFIHVLTSHW